MGCSPTPRRAIPIVAMLLGYNGPIAEGERVLRPAREFGQPLADLVAPMPYGVRQSMLDDPNAIHGLHRYWRSAFTEQLDDGLFDAMVEEAAAFSSPLSALLFFYVHGAATRVPSGDTAFAARSPQWDFDAIGCWGEGAESDRHISWVKSAWDRFEPHLKGDAYINHLSADDAPEKVRASYGANHERLRILKGKYDPTNLFRINPNIQPG